jgi:hypothetical protein
METNKKPKLRIKFHHIIQEEYPRMLRFFKDNFKQKLLTITDNQVTEFISGDSFIDTNSEYSMRVDKIFCYKVKIIKNKSEKHCFKREFLVTSFQPFTKFHYFTVYIYNNTCFDNSIYSVAIKSDVCEVLSLMDAIYNIPARLAVANNVKKILKYYIEDLYQIESILIKANINKVWEIISNWKKFQEIHESVPEVIETNGLFNIINTVFVIRVVEKKLYLKVKLSAINKHEAKYELECFIDKNLTKLFMEINILIIKISLNSSFIKFTHQFMIHNSSDHITLIRDEKRLTLTLLKKILEEK